MMDGKLIRLYRDLRYGFIKSNNTDYFFHQSDYRGDWKGLCDSFDQTGPHDKPVMQFVPDSTPKGLRARDVTFWNE
jgi:hypothetical protein